jgi:aspartate aminotransferase
MSIDERLASTDFPLPVIRQVNMAKHAQAISLGLGELKGFTVDDRITQALTKSLAADGFAYAPNAGLVALRDAIAKSQQAADGYNYTAENVVVGIGVQNAFYATLNALKKMGAKRVLVPEVYFGIYLKVPHEFGFETALYKLTPNFGIDLEQLAQQLRPDDILVINSPANPTGRVFTATEQANLAKVLHQKLMQGYVLSDEIYSKLVYNGEYGGTFTKFFDRTIVLDGISKSGAAAGLRVGWAITRNLQLAKAITSVNAGIISCPPTAVQHAAIPVVSGLTTETINHYNHILAQNCQQASQILAQHGIGFITPRGSFYLFVNVAPYTGTNTKAFCIAAASNPNGVVVIPGEAFGAPGFVRLSLASANVAQGVERLVAHLHQYKKITTKIFRTTIN